MLQDTPFFLDVRIARNMLKKVSSEMKERYPGYSKTLESAHSWVPEVCLRWYEAYSTSSMLPSGMVQWMWAPIIA